ncbi:SMP-30/gluconolactonase/LRE family protein [Pelagibius litoralis]|uniref:SMP-30/gluconolactonase/LRE family protein n=1 Tax=Pelagibius litoralis TaxID=374515 RepID=A0A967C8V8_9PROT|nr:SMP-30/gluconolactonase/LRE family protein [Pelagibius litoralis]NIA68892.1 SMP-30/gluconolactonase/LRE family protein [Pelagibius litoralis]
MPDSQAALSLDDVTLFGSGLVRPECLLCTSSGDIFSADWRGGVALSRTFGEQELFQAPGGVETIKPNGIALQRDGSFLIANLDDSGGVFRLDRDGKLSEVLRQVDGIDLPATNFVLIDDRSRVWVTVSTRRSPRALGYRPDVDDGFIVLIDGHGARIVADGLGYTNELAIDSQGLWLYVNETFARRLSRFRIGRRGDLTDKEVVTEFGPGTFPDGLAFDMEDHLWVTSIVSNRVIRVAPDGSQKLILEDCDPDHLAEVEKAFQDGVMDRPHLDRNSGRKLRNISSLAFGGPDLRTAYLGCLLGDQIASIRTEVMGRPPVHWHFNV